MNPTALADVVSTIGFGLALLFVILLPVGESRPYVRPIKTFLVVAMALYVFVGASNVLEWSGVTKALDVYEDYAEVLFLPLMAYLVFSLATVQQYEALKSSQELVLREQELLVSVVEASPAGIMVVARDGRVTFANDIARDAFGLRAADGGAYYKTPDDVLFGPEEGSVASVAEGLRDLVSMDQVDDVIRYVTHPGGETVALDVGIRPLHAEGREASGSVVAFVDITERLRYRQDLERAVDARTRELIEVNRQLEVANDAKKEFLARMSHELRTPLNSILGFAGTLLQGSAGELAGEQRRQLEMIRASGATLMALVNDVVDIALIETGRTTTTWTETDACALVRSVCELMRPVFSDRQIDVDVECDGEASLSTDADKVAQIVRNLVGNAVKFTDAGGWVRVVVRGAPHEVTITVADSGRGIAEEDVPKVFLAFKQLRDGSGAKPEGTGLGLAICKDLAELLGGSVDVQSVLGTGSTFTLTLPRRSA